MSVYTATVTSKGQVTIPRHIRRLLNLHEGETLVFEETGRSVVQVRAARRESRLEGCLRDRVPRDLPPPTRDDIGRAVADGARRGR